MTQSAEDLALLSRRQSLLLLGGLALAGCGAGDGATGDRPPPPPGSFGGPPPGAGFADVTAPGPDGTACVAFPGETEGPFPADGTNGRPARINVLDQAGVERSDLRSSFAGLSGVAEGVPLDLAIAVVDVDARCAPLAGRAIYLWHCDAAGAYSLYERTDRNYLRGLQVTDRNGVARFLTIFPACYPGRFPHIHFEVFADRGHATTGRAALLTSQLALPADAAGAVYEQAAAYQASRRTFAHVSLASDGVFADNTPAQLRAQTLRLAGDPARGYRATATVGLTARYG